MWPAWQCSFWTIWTHVKKRNKHLLKEEWHALLGQIKSLKLPLVVRGVAGVQFASWTTRWKDVAHCHASIAFASRVSSIRVAESWANAHTDCHASCIFMFLCVSFVWTVVETCWKTFKLNHFIYFMKTVNLARFSRVAGTLPIRLWDCIQSWWIGFYRYHFDLIVRERRLSTLPASSGGNRPSPT